MSVYCLYFCCIHQMMPSDQPMCISLLSSTYQDRWKGNQTGSNGFHGWVEFKILFVPHFQYMLLKDCWGLRTASQETKSSNQWGKDGWKDMCRIWVGKEGWRQISECCAGRWRAGLSKKEWRRLSQRLVGASERNEEKKKELDKGGKLKWGWKRHKSGRELMNWKRGLRRKQE